MPLENLHSGENTAWALWKIEEEEFSLAKNLQPYETIPDSITHPAKRLEFLAGRCLLKALLENWSLMYHGLTKDPYGKPFLSNHPFHISLSHSYPYVAAIINRTQTAGIDLEQPKEKLLRIAPRVLDKTELEDAGKDIIKHCIYWCAKESLVKIHGKKDLVFAENLKISPFSLANEGQIVGRIIVDHTETSIPLQYQVHRNFVLVMNR